jgi:hypothetical protein
MESTKNELSSFANDFFHRLREFLDTKLYFYGSIQRNDYFPQSSDIDVDIFTDNISSTLSKLQMFLNTKKSSFKNCVLKAKKANKIVCGKKVKFDDEDHHFSAEFSIYETKDKEDVLHEHNSKAVLPYLVSFLLIILKFFYYKLNFLSKTTFVAVKRYVMCQLVQGMDSEFVTI